MLAGDLRSAGFPRALRRTDIRLLGTRRRSVAGQVSLDVEAVDLAPAAGKNGTALAAGADVVLDVLPGERHLAVAAVDDDRLIGCDDDGPDHELFAGTRLLAGHAENQIAAALLHFRQVSHRKREHAPIVVDGCDKRSIFRGHRRRRQDLRVLRQAEDGLAARLRP